jgi:hypothetical protein
MRELGVPQPDINPGSSQFPAMHVPTEAPAAAFGGGSEVAGAFKAGQELSDTISGIAEKHQQQANQVMHTDIDTQLAGLQAKVQVQAQQMRGKDAMGAQAMAQNAWSQGVSEILKQAQPNQDVYRSVSASAAARGMALNDAVHQHATSELFQYENNQTVAGIKGAQNLAAINANDPQAVGREMGQIETLATQYFKRNGIDPDSDSGKEFIQTQKSGTYRAVIDEAIKANNFNGAQAYFDQAKKENNLTAEDLDHLNTQMQQAKISNTVLQVFNANKKNTLPGGIPNGAKMEADVDKLTDLNDKEKVDVKTGLYEMSLHQQRLIAEQDVARQRGFENQILQARKNNPNLSMAQMTQMANVGFKDQVDLRNRMNFIQNEVAPKDSDNDTFNRLYDGIHRGEITDKSDIDTAYNNGKINNKDYKVLTDSYVTNITEGKNPATQMALSEIQKNAVSDLPNAKDRAQYLAVVKREAGGKTPEELRKFAQDELGTHKEKGRLWGTNDVKNWKTDFQKNQAEDTAFGKLHEDVGVSQINGIIDGFARTENGRKAGLTEISQFADSVGGYNNLKTGQPANNAIQSILKRGGVVTPASVNAVLKIKKDGIF